MSGQIDLRDQRLVAGVDRLSERCLIAPEFIVGGQQADPGATGANCPRRILQACIEGSRIRRLTQIESLWTDADRISDHFVLGDDVAGEKRARNGSAANECPDTPDS